MSATATTAGRHAPRPWSVALLRVVAADIKIAHSVFALPFAVLGAFMAASWPGGAIEWRSFAGRLALVVAAMVLARTAAMLSNRLLDRRIDALNPRTAGRAIPGGRLPPRTAAVLLGGAAVGFLAVCCAFGALNGNWWPAALGVPVLGWICAYPLCKRFTSLSHLYLGSALAISPLAAALAVQPQALAQPSLWMLAAMVLCWVGGFDVIYALQDVEVDRAQGLYSLPGRLGVGPALWVSRLLHAASAGLLVAVALFDPRMGPLFGAGVAVGVALLLWEQATVARWGTKRIALAFFTLNGAISCVLGALGAVDVAIA
jgi:4-hydroxybenzoate polyprenyltransferase